eukprot:TRINITY_DN11630_c0_g1_i4.p1 TRINITY_DN11630_c0_g1~~TRINITY_DN11630_c0_g1_i4.p1  ORF type:complete len:974 (+),score=217.53 TRINITY_DN11630_c0_g1_i4:166-3087(+)
MAHEEHDVVLLIDENACYSAAILANFVLTQLTRPGVTVHWHHERVCSQDDVHSSSNGRRNKLVPFNPATFNSFCSQLMSSSTPPSESDRDAAMIVADVRSWLLEHIPKYSWSPLRAASARHQLYIVSHLPTHQDEHEGWPGMLLDKAMLRQLDQYHVALTIVNTNPEAIGSFFVEWMEPQLDLLHGALLHLHQVDAAIDLHQDGVAFQSVLAQPSVVDTATPTNSANKAAPSSRPAALESKASRRRHLRHDVKTIAQHWRTGSAEPVVQADLQMEGKAAPCCARVSAVPLRDSAATLARLDAKHKSCEATLHVRGIISMEATLGHIDFRSGLLVRGTCPHDQARESAAWLQLLLHSQQAQCAIVADWGGPCLLLPLSINTAACYCAAELRPEPLPETLRNTTVRSQGELPAVGLHTYLPNATTMAVDRRLDDVDDNIHQTVTTLQQQGQNLERIRWLSPLTLIHALRKTGNINLTRREWQERLQAYQGDLSMAAVRGRVHLPLQGLNDNITVDQMVKRVLDVYEDLRHAKQPNLDTLSDAVASAMSSLTRGSSQCQLLHGLAEHVKMNVPDLIDDLQAPFRNVDVNLEPDATATAKQANAKPKKKGKSKRKLPSITRTMSSTNLDADNTSAAATKATDVAANDPAAVSKQRLERAVRDTQLQVFLRCHLLLLLATNPNLKRIKMPVHVSGQDYTSNDSEASMVEAATVKQEIADGLMELFRLLQPVQALAARGIVGFAQLLEDHFKQEIPGTWRNLLKETESSDSDEDMDDSMAPSNPRSDGLAPSTATSAKPASEPSTTSTQGFTKPKVPTTGRTRSVGDANHGKQITIAVARKRGKGPRQSKRSSHKLVMDTPARDINSAAVHIKRNVKRSKAIDDTEEVPETPIFATRKAAPTQRATRSSRKAQGLSSAKRNGTESRGLLASNGDAEHASGAAHGDFDDDNVDDDDDIAQPTPKKKRVKRALSTMYRPNP